MPIRWTAAEPAHLAREQAEVMAITPGLTWTTGLRVGRRDDLVGFTGPLPDWCAHRPKPDGLNELLAGRRLHVALAYREATPMVPPAVYATDPDVPVERRTDHTWHVNGDGSLCLLQTAEDWIPGSTAVPLIVKATCWFVEYCLMEAGLINQMTERGLPDDTSYDHLIGERP